MKPAIGALVLASAFVTVGCAQAFTRHDVFERSDLRIGHAIKGAQRTCQARQPKTGLPSATGYEQCVLEALREAEPTLARH